MFDLLAQKFSTIFSHLRGHKTLTPAVIKETLQTVEQALLEADVPYQLVQRFITTIEQEVQGQKLVTSLKPAEQLLKIVYDTLVSFFGGQTAAFSFTLPAIVLVLGLQGSGKTTTIAKLAQYIKQHARDQGKKRSILLASVDFYRPAAIDQLAILAQQTDVSFYRATSTDPVVAAKEIHAYYTKGGYDVLFLDTAGRMHIDNRMLEELRAIDSALEPAYKLLILDAMTGQESLAVARAFDQAVGFYGAVLSKMDSDTRGGAAFAFRYALNKPILFVGTGEKIDDLTPFYPDRAANRILGMGDINSLIEQANRKIKESEAAAAARAFNAGKLTLVDFASQLDMVNKLGSLSSIAKYLPGMGGLTITPEALEQGEVELKKFRAIINSMTPIERINPSLLNSSRKERIARGSGTKVSDITRLLERFEYAQRYLKQFKKSGSFKNFFK